MRILIIGGTGKTGRELIKQGLAKGHTITVFARKPGKIREVHQNLRVVPGNILDPTTLAPALLNQDAVLSALGHKRFVIRTNTLSEGTKNLISGMEQLGVKRLICITSLGIADSRYRLGLYYSLFVIPVLLFFYFRDKEKQERVIRESNLDWTIVRPGQLTNGKKRTRYRTGPGLGHYIFTRLVSRATVAGFMLDELAGRNYLKQVSGITN
ncbi:NAD(P)-dependent oxidoreductase [Zeaxanthinibacter enoshimensis]|uniref:Putative NADH-flavin reductase n=1 Tax=Zeaxanthinibacter enoshimensis TaxID=392009 RepID=A0A4R6TMK6_9FLAO|nr:SDR family oxidoreductase [Zeaxanthinibacter enoshimensis]TDQ30969.1 putative NADH-flavin reductase [Zeaxanthinibacter enoshimensis]